MNQPNMIDQHQAHYHEAIAVQLQNSIRHNLNWFLLAGLTLLIVQDIFGTHGVLAMRRSQRQACEIQTEIEELNKENQQLEDRVKSLKTDPVAIEHILREERHLGRPGEYVFPVPALPADSSTQNSPAQKSPRNP